MNIGIITGSTRDSRVGNQVADWVLNVAKEAHPEHDFKILDIKEYNLPLYNEPVPAIFAESIATPEAVSWSEDMSKLDGFIFVTPEYNRNVTPSLKNALDYLFNEVSNKSAGIISYGSAGGTLAAMSLRNMLSVPNVAVVGSQPSFNIFIDFENMQKFTPGDYQKQPVITTIAQVVAWGTALKQIR